MGEKAAFTRAFNLGGRGEERVYFLEEPYEMRISLVFQKKENLLFSTASKVKGFCDRCFSLIPQS